MVSTQKATNRQAEARNGEQSRKKSASVSTTKTPAKDSNKAPNKVTDKATTGTGSASTGTSKGGKLPSMRDVQEQKRKERQEKIAAARKNLEEKRRIRLEHQKQRREELQRKHKWTMVTFTVGLFVMLTALICLFPSTGMIIFSTLLMFSFFFLGIAFQRMVMQLLVIALATVFIVGAFYTILGSI